MPTRRYFLSALIGTALVDSTGLAAPAAGWQPTRPIEIVVPSGAGGGLDTIGRVVQRVMHDLRVTGQPINVVNKPGGNGAIGTLYANEHRGDGHYIVMQSPALLIDPLEGIGSVGLKDTTPIATLVDDQIFFSVSADSPFQTGRDLAHALGADPSSVSIGMSSSAGGHSHIAIATVTKQAGGDPRKLKLVAFNGGGEAVTALLGGHVMLAVTPASSILGPLQTGKLRVLAISAAQRLTGPLSTTPTWKEQGINAVVFDWRAVMGPVGLKAPELAWWDSALGRVIKAPQWEEYVRREQWTDDYRDSAAAAIFFVSESQRYAEILKQLGLLKTAA
jgi:putative tricarboxylic transport membrane protein